MPLAEPSDPGNGVPGKSRVAVGALYKRVLQDFRENLVPVALLLAVYLICYHLLGKYIDLPEKAYREAVIFWQPLLRPDIWKLPVIAGLLLLLLFGRKRVLNIRWQQLPFGTALRWFVSILAGLLTWTWAGYDFNYYFAQWHAADRLLLLAAWFGIIWRPVAVLPFLLILAPLIAQFHYPIGHYSVAVPWQPLRMLIAFLAMLLLGGLRRTYDVKHFFLLTLCILLAGYWVPGTGKFNTQWLLHDRVGYLLPATYANGWLGFLPPQDIGMLTGWLDRFNWPLKLLTLALEGGVLFFFWNRRIAWVLLAIMPVFHAGVFLTSGICFWLWACLEMSLLLLLVTNRDKPELQLFTPGYAVLGLVLIGAGALWVHPVKLAWYDAKGSYTYRIMAETVSGSRGYVAPLDLAPYDYQFTQGAFGFLDSLNALPIVWGATDQTTEKRLATVGDAAGFAKLEQQVGRMCFNRTKALRMERFIQVMFANRNRLGTKSPWWRILTPPPLLWTFPRNPPWKKDEPVTVVSIYRITSFYDGQNYSEIANRVVREIEIPQQ